MKSDKLNIVDIEKGLEDLAQASVSPEQYGLDLLLLFSSPNTVKRVTGTSTNKSDVEGGLLWREKFHYAPSAKDGLDETMAALKQSKVTAKHKVRLLIVNDGMNVLVYDRKYDNLTQSTISEIKNEPHIFLPLTGEEGYRKEHENEVDIKATGKLAKLYDALVEKNPDWLEGDKRHALNHFMTQIIFCLFAEDTGIFPEDIFTKTLKNRAGANGQDATSLIQDIFNTLDCSDENRTATPSWLRQFPYVNGGLFSGQALVPEFTSKAFRYLLEASSLDWKHVNPDILGSSIQAIVDPTMRGNLGMHYTSVPNILKTLDPLFLNDLRDDFFKSRHNKKQLEAFLKRLSNIVVMDPACGSGNFLVIAYRELRKLELQALDALRDISQGASMAFGFSTMVSLSNFYGIEYADFAAETAKLALWIAEYQQNARFAAAFGNSIPALPLRNSGNILCKNALRVDWSEFCPLNDSSETYLVGNPPYLGSSRMDKEQKADMSLVFAARTNSFKTLDYVCAWFFKATQYCVGKNAAFAFVATNSIVQGGHVPTLWPLLFGTGMEIGFAYTSFKWKNNASNNAGVTCVIVGMRNESVATKFIYTNDEAIPANNVNGYLLDAPTIEITKQGEPAPHLPKMDRGSSPIDGGNLLLSASEKKAVIEQDPNLERLIKRYVGSEELIKGTVRYCLWIADGDLDLALSNDWIRNRIEQVKTMRLQSTKKATQDQAQSPHRFGEIRQYHSALTIAIPRVSSENREYLPVDVLTQGEIISDRNFGIYDGPMWALALIASKMHHVWIATVCVRLEERFSYSNTIGWNTFPAPDLTDEQKERLNQSARNIILTREGHFPKTIADLYDPQKMPEDLRQAHEDNDKLIDSLYREEPFADENDRLTHLFERYVELTQG